MSRTATDLCIYGGTFSPFHRGHTAAIQAYTAQYAPDLLLVIPAAQSPGKAASSGVTGEDRLCMARLACVSLPGYGERIAVSDYEIAAGGLSYTWRTLEHFACEGRKLTFLCGPDLFLSMERWQCAERIFALSRVACFHRCRDDSGISAQIARCAERYRQHFSADTVTVTGECVEISSTALREAIAAHRNTDAYLDPRVRDYIDAHRLFCLQEVTSHDA